MAAPHSKLIPSSRNFESVVTALAAGAATITVTLDRDYRHWFVAVEYYDAVGGLVADVVTPTTGTETYTVRTPVKPNKDQTFVDNVVNSADDEQANWGSPADSVKVVLATVDVATHVRVRAVGVVS